MDRYATDKNCDFSFSGNTFHGQVKKLLHGVVFDGLTKFTDYTFFGKFYRKRNDYGGKLERDNVGITQPSKI